MKKAVAKKSAAKKAATKKMPAKKAAAKKAAPKKTVVRKPAAKKPAAKKPVPKKAAPKVQKPAAPKTPPGIPEKLRDAALKTLDERQAEDIVTVSLAGRSSVADYMIIASGRAGRQIAAIADHLRDAFLKNGASSIRVEGKSEANWVLVDAGDVIVHLFRPEVRSYYDLDAIWAKSRK
ncbi:MAG: ribosome silencing factor [Alphaproteobacteria bacterium]|nr:ribosome silencing factor [Alphaproteobacteria bacterium]